MDGIYGITKWFLKWIARLLWMMCPLKNQNDPEYGSILHDCRALPKTYNNYEVVFSRRQGNVFLKRQQANDSAQTLSRAALSHAPRCVLFITFQIVYLYFTY
jgi:hypothetical protein